MSNKVWHSVEIYTEEQNIRVMPSEDFSCIVVETKEIDGSTSACRTYLNLEEMELLISKMRDMMAYVNDKS